MERWHAVESVLCIYNNSRGARKGDVRILSARVGPLTS
jgi:hypothetical protein